MRTRPRLAAIVVSLAAGSLVSAPAVSAQEADLPTGEVLRNAQMVERLLASRASRLSTSAGPDPDTVYVGKSYTNHTAVDNYWNIYVGTYRPGTNDPTNAFWDWDNSVGIQAPDSLHGWWPMHRQYNSTGGLILTDDQRPWWALDHGNIANYVISQAAAAKRTFGVVGMWHADPGSAAGSAVRWSPLSGSKSAWCGLRQHGDNTHKDVQTNQPFNQNAVSFLHDASAGFAGGGAGNNFPGYPDQIDQMLYRDISVLGSENLTVSFLYRTRMSTSIGTTASTRTGWFHGDPLAVTGVNFISSSTAGTSAPQDSFMVYVGAPVNDAACVYSDGVTRPVYDKQRRWFSEVLKVFGAGNTYYEIFKTTGNNPADTLSATPSSGPIVIPAAQIASIIGGGGSGTVRLVFRCKTNRGFADSDTRTSGYTSAGRGAVQIDDVTIDTGSGPLVIGDFEGTEQGGANTIDNRFDAAAPPSVTTLTNWRSTGKPPGEYMHVEAMSGLAYADLCGPPDSPKRRCNIGGLVITVGNHDDGENAGDSRFAAFREISQLIVSPTINLVPGAGGVANSMGISATIRDVNEDILIWYDIYTGMFNLSFSGESWVYGAQCYPGIQPNGAECWTQPQFPGFLDFNPEPQCFSDFQGFFANGNPLRTSRSGGIPDSLRIFPAHQQQCFRFAVSLACNSNEGGYFDNATVAFVDGCGCVGDPGFTLGGLAGDIWQFVNDTFPSNETPGLPGTAAFDTTTGYIRTGLNNAQGTGNTSRFDIPGDSSSVTAGNAGGVGTFDPALIPVRMDLVFRVLPGPGNYQIAAGRSMVPGGVPSGVLLQVPTNQAAAAVAGDASWWGQYMLDPGLVSAGSHSGGWSNLVWNSCRMDTTELNIFRVSGPPATVNPLLGGITATRGWMTMIHESDPKFATLGVVKFKCFTIDTLKSASTNTGPVGTNNVVCDGTVPTWLTTVPQSRTGWDGLSTTREFSKIIPDGLLTPGSHVQYFIRKSHNADPFLNYAMMPDTNFIMPQTREGSTDQHRWQQFSVLPDRWKSFGGVGAACMLYVDLNDRRGNEGHFVGVMDSLCATSSAKFGAHNGWHAPGNVSIDGLDVRTNLSVAVSNQNSQPGTTWDMYGVKASESITTQAGSLGSRLANRAAMGFAAGRESRQGPTPEMLRAYYRMVAILTGDLNSGIFGPFVNRSQNDLTLLQNFLEAAGGTAQPRGLFIQGDGFGQSEDQTGSAIDPNHTAFLPDYLGLVFRSVSYQSLSGNLNDCADLLTTSALTGTDLAFGVSNLCQWSNDVYTRNASLPETTEGGFYENAGLMGPYVSDIVKLATPARNWVALTSAYDIEHLSSQYCNWNYGRISYYYYMLNRVFGSMCQITGPPNCVLDTPQSGRGRDFVDFMRIGDAVKRSGPVAVHLGLAHTGRARICIYDVAGRHVRLLADRLFPAGEHTLLWDGTSDQGQRAPRGVYFVRSSNQEGAGRVVVLN